MNISIEKAARGHELLSEITLPGSLENVFDFFSDAYNLQQITPPYLNFEILTSRPIKMATGTLIDYKLRLRGIPIRWRTRISTWEPPFRFVDEQLKGPYKIWRHEHTFEAQGNSTLARDRVHYVSPLAFITHPLMVTRDVKRIFEYRSAKLKSIFQS